MSNNSLNKLSRRAWIEKSSLFALGTLLTGAINSCAKNQLSKTSVETILVVSGWQDVNIGDIAHTPGLLNVLRTFLPNAKIILWKKSTATDEVKLLLKNNFPDVKVIYGGVDSERNVSSVSVINAFNESDIMIHGSGPSVVGQSNLEAWVKHTEKPFGIFGVTIQGVSDTLKELLLKSSFIFTRETKSLNYLKEAGIPEKLSSFAPDATFFMDIHDEAKANIFLDENDLEAKNYICVIPRLRYTPYHKFKTVNWSEEKIRKVEETNLKYKEVDHAKLREAMIRWIRETGNKVLVCPEMTYEIDIMDELLIDPLPEDVKPYVVKRGYWLPDEAASIYKNAKAVLSFECHSPIIALFNGTPAFYLRQPEDTIKGNMYYDLEYDDWLFEIMETEGSDIADRLMEVNTNYGAALAKVATVNERIYEIYKSAVKIIES